MTIKFEKITLWTAVETYGDKGSGVFEGATALDYILPALNEKEKFKWYECHILDHDTENYELVKVEEK